MLNIFNIIFLLFLINIYICEANGTLSENIESAEEIDALKTNLRNGYLNNTYFNEENNNLNIENEINNTNYNEVTEETKEELYDINENIFPDYFFLDIFTENKEQKNEEVPMKIEVVNDGEEVKTEYVSEKNEEVENKSETEIGEELTEKVDEKVPEEVAEELVEKVDEEVAEELVEKVDEKVAEEVDQKVDEEVTEELIEKVDEEVTEELIEKVDEEVAEELIEKVDEEVAEELIEKVADELVEKVAEELVEKVDEQVAEELVEKEIKDSSDFKESHEELFKVFLELINKNDLVKENLKKITNNLNEMHLSTLYP
ncbi:hypothetical protein PFMC_03047 [Plasmodium falciparum CAMP/Malaysia]|uniref:PUM-HD domain-containing protein n=1 Tax=Plasmodium falciparum (isolate Camp / Malaysia) TaxID=5835 RepID=A0A024X7K5_PLAFC|nr:hypothetical protein PFMC_03047 [Plasmodium falciparum CAMP/Malaysia]